MASRVGEMQIVLTMQTAAFVRALADSKRRLKEQEQASLQLGRTVDRIASGITRHFSAVRAAVVAAAAAFAGFRAVRGLDKAADDVDRLGKAARRLGVDVQSMSALRFTAGQANVEFEELAALVAKAGKNIAAIVDDGRSSVRIGRMQVQLTDAAGEVRGLTELLPDLARGLESAGSQAEQLRLAEQIFGRGGGGRFIDLLKESGGYLRNLTQQTEAARRLGVLFSEDQVQRLTEYRDAVDLVSQAWFGLKVRVIDELAPQLTAAAKQLASFLASIPAIAGRAVDMLQRAWAGDGEAMQGIRDLLTSAADVLRVGALELVKVFGVTVISALSFFWDLLADEIKRGLASALTKGLSWGAQAFAPSLVPSLQALQGGLSAPIDPQKVGARLAESVIDRGGAMDVQLRDSRDAIAGAVSGFAGTADRLLGVMRELSAHSMDFKLNLEDAGEEIQSSAWGNFVTGLSAGLEELSNRVEDVAVLGRDVIVTMGEQISSGLSDAIVDATTSWKDFGKAVLDVLEDVARSVVKTALNFAILRAFTGLAAGPVGLLASANGNAFDRGRVTPFARGGVVDRPTLFPMAEGAGLMGEAGPEAVMPLTRIGGNLGVRAVGGGVVVQVIDQRRGGAPVDVSEQQGPDGRRLVRLLIRDEVRGMIGDGTLDRPLAAAYGLGRRGATR